MNYLTLQSYVYPPVTDECKNMVRSYMIEDFTRSFEVVRLMKERAYKDVIRDKLLLQISNRDYPTQMAKPSGTYEPGLDEKATVNESLLNYEKASQSSKTGTLLLDGQEESSLDEVLNNEIRKSMGEQSGELLRLINSYLSQQINDL